MDTSTSTAFQLRLQWLEAILSNPESTIRQSLLYSREPSQLKTSPKHDDRTTSVSDNGKDVTGRTADLLQQLRNVVLDSGHDSLRRLIDECESSKHPFHSSANRMNRQAHNGLTSGYRKQMNLSHLYCFQSTHHHRLADMVNQPRESLQIHVKRSHQQKRRTLILQP